MNDSIMRKVLQKSLIFSACMLTVMSTTQLSIRCQTQRSQTPSDVLDEMSNRSSRLGLAVPQPAGVPLEATIDPEHYFVGPSDVIAVNIWISPPVSLALTVTPEGTLIVPTVGEVRVSDLTLAAAKRKIIAEIRKKYITAEATSTLITPRPIVVTVTGTVLYPGLYTLTAVDRANKAIEEANRLGTYDVRREVPEMSTRNVVLKHKDGTLSRVDIQKFLGTREDRWDPYLREGDVVIVPRKSDTRNTIAIYGEVNVPGRYEYVEGDSLRDLIEIAQGLTPRALGDSVRISRLSSDASSLKDTLINAADILKGSMGDFALEPGDGVVVRAKTDLREDYRATILGEVVNPGTYPITRNATHLTEFIRQAGGFTTFASLPRAFVIRQRFSGGGGHIDTLVAFLGRIPDEDETYFNYAGTIRLRRETVSVDFERLFADHDSLQDIILCSEDTVYVPGKSRTVYVFGQVVSPGYIAFVPGQPVEFYLDKAGGTLDAARLGSIKVIKAMNKQWLSPDKTSIEEGDYIWVPKNPERPFTYYLNLIGQTASIISVAVSIVLLVIQVNK